MTMIILLKSVTHSWVVVRVPRPANFIRISFSLHIARCGGSPWIRSTDLNPGRILRTGILWLRKLHCSSTGVSLRRVLLRVLLWVLLWELRRRRLWVIWRGLGVAHRRLWITCWRGLGVSRGVWGRGSFLWRPWRRHSTWKKCIDNFYSENQAAAVKFKVSVVAFIFASGGGSQGTQRGVQISLGHGPTWWA